EGSATYTNQVVATFTDPGGAEHASDYSAVINWGDGSTSVGTISVPDVNGVFTVTGSHTYSGDNIVNASNESEGTANVTVTISHDATTAQVVNDTAQINDPNVVAASPCAPPSRSEGSATYTNQVVATFTDPGGAEHASDYSAVINWG